MYTFRNLTTKTAKLFLLNDLRQIFNNSPKSQLFSFCRWRSWAFCPTLRCGESLCGATAEHPGGQGDASGDARPDSTGASGVAQHWVQSVLGGGAMAAMEFCGVFVGILCKILGHRIHVGNVVLEWFGDKNSICISCFMPQYFWDIHWSPFLQTKKSGSHVPDVHNTVLMAQMTYVCTCLII